MQAIAGEGQPLRYLMYLLESWQWALPILLALVVAGWRRHKALMAAALLNLILHQLIEHKEYRYIWLSMQAFLLLAAFGSVDLVRRKRPQADDGRATAALVGGWALVSLLLSLSSIHRHAFRTDNDPARAAFAAIRDPATCGIAVPMRRYWQFGYSLLHSDKPLFLVGDQGPVTRWNPGGAASGFNALLTYEADPPPPAPWRKHSCSGQQLPLERTCLYVRPGGCRIDERSRTYLMQQVMLSAGM